MNGNFIVKSTKNKSTVYSGFFENDEVNGNG